MPILPTTAPRYQGFATDLQGGMRRSLGSRTSSSIPLMLRRIFRFPQMDFEVHSGGTVLLVGQGGFGLGMLLTSLTHDNLHLFVSVCSLANGVPPDFATASVSTRSPALLLPCPPCWFLGVNTIYIRLTQIQEYILSQTPSVLKKKKKKKNPGLVLHHIRNEKPMGTRRSSVLGCTIVPPLSYVLCHLCAVLPLIDTMYGHGFLGIVKMMFFMVFIDFVLVGAAVASFCWLISLLIWQCVLCSCCVLYPRFTSNRFLTHTSSIHSTDQSVEWAYAFDVHCNSFFPLFLALYVVQFFFMPLLISHSWVALFVGNSMYLFAACYYSYITFLGYNGGYEDGTRTLIVGCGMLLVLLGLTPGRCRDAVIPIRVQREQPCAAIVFWQLDRTSGNRMVSVIPCPPPSPPSKQYRSPSAKASPSSPITAPSAIIPSPPSSTVLFHRQEWLDAVRWAANCDDAKVTVITGKGKYYTSGQELIPPPPPKAGETMRDVLTKQCENTKNLIAEMIRFPKLLIGAVNGNGSAPLHYVPPLKCRLIIT
ncbi:hypothetical protein BC936DRAFT_145905 [Jimgerdemannia flammicorona]|uniref:Uncharacterized protein n=1 Tax=Jimgerdemannia flammicorona TaxID=994334 RepID=A0A433D8Y1_9FUNG|nr:hypothetical protein BC936DRAFT_145905 [Jimgerdemannia flammicorona]